MSRRPVATRTTGRMIGTIALSVVAFFAAVAFVLFTVLWGAESRQTWTVALGMLLPIAMTVLAASLLTAHFVRLRLARTAEIRQTLEEELQTIFKTDRG